VAYTKYEVTLRCFTAIAIPVRVDKRDAVIIENIRGTGEKERRNVNNAISNPIKSDKKQREKT
jgi:hypothetical protein